MKAHCLKGAFGSSRICLKQYEYPSWQDCKHSNDAYKHLRVWVDGFVLIVERAVDIVDFGIRNITHSEIISIKNKYKLDEILN